MYGSVFKAYASALHYSLLCRAFGISLIIYLLKLSISGASFSRLSSISDCIIEFKQKIMNVANMITPSADLINDKKEMPRLEDAPWYEKTLNASFKIKLINGKLVQVTYKQLSNGTIKIGDEWVK